MNKDNCIPTVARVSVASEIISFASILATKAEDTSVRTDDKLSSVMRSPDPEVDELSDAIDGDYPPLFDELRNSFRIIEKALNGINHSLNRAEI